MNKEEYIELKKSYSEMVTAMLKEKGGLNPSITIFGVEKKSGKNAILYLGIEPMYIKDEKSKDLFVELIIPRISKDIRKDFDINAVVWASEAWVREFDKSATEIELEEWESAPIKKEVVIIVINSEKENETIVREIIRKGKQVNSEGKLTDTIELVDVPRYNAGVIGDGRFSDLYRKFTESV
jgi:hypothetical protein